MPSPSYDVTRPAGSPPRPSRSWGWRLFRASFLHADPASRAKWSRSRGASGFIASLVLLLTMQPALCAEALSTTTSPGSLTQEILEAKIAEVEAATDMEEGAKTKLVEFYRKALSNLKAASSNAQAAEEFRRAAETAPTQVQMLRKELDRFTWIFVPAVLVTMVATNLDPLDRGGVLGRVSFLIVVTSLSVAFARLLHPKRGVLVGFARGPQRRTFRRLQRLWYPLVALYPLAMALRCFVSSTELRYPTLSDLNEAINDKFNDAGISIAFPQRDLHLDTIRPLQVELRRG